MPVTRFALLLISLAALALPASAAAIPVEESLWVPDASGAPQVEAEATAEVPSLSSLGRHCVPGVEYETPGGTAISDCSLYGQSGAILQGAGVLKIAATDAPAAYTDGGSAILAVLPDGAFIHYTCDGGFGCFAKVDPTGPRHRFNLSRLRFEWAFERPTVPRLSAEGIDLRVYTGSIAVSLTGRHMVFVSPSRILWIDRASGQVWQVTTTPSAGLGFSLDTPLAVSPSGRYVAVGANAWGNTLRVFDMETCSAIPQPFTSTCSSVDLDDLLNDSRKTFYPGRVSRLVFNGESQLSFAARSSLLPGGSDSETRQFLLNAAGGEPRESSAAFLGDSFMSGEGVQSLSHPNQYVYLDGTDEYDLDDCEETGILRWCKPVNLCHVADDAWPDKLAFLLGLSQFSTFACSGALTSDIRNVTQYEDTAIATPGFPGSEPQSASLARLQPAPQRIFIQIGGNDAGFADILQKCAGALPGDCSADPDQRREFALRIRDSFYTVRDTLASLRAGHGDQSDLYLVGYPAIVDPDPDRACGNNVQLSTEERAFSSQLQAYVEAVGRAAAASAGVRYVSLADSIEEHQLCDPTPWVNGRTKGDDPPLFGVNGVAKESYHPRREAHAAFAGTIAAAIVPEGSGNPPADPAATAPAVPTWGLGQIDIRDWDPAVDGTPGAVAMPRVHADQLLPGSAVTGYFASDPSPFAPHSVDADGRLTFSPAPAEQLPPGAHVLHLHATAANQTELHAQIPVLIPAAGDADADGIPDEDDGCPLIPASSPADQDDLDGDGQADGCDPLLTDAPEGDDQGGGEPPVVLPVGGDLPAFPILGGDTPGAAAAGDSQPSQAILPCEIAGKGRLAGNRRALLALNVAGRSPDFEGGISFRDRQAGLVFRSTRVTEMTVSGGQGGQEAEIRGRGRANRLPVDFRVQLEDGRPNRFRIVLSGSLRYIGGGALHRGDVAYDCP